jgi:pimeloyl-ACP methyl ester carboxylesterase
MDISVVTPELSIGCLVGGPPDGRPMILLHGWPDDALTWTRVVPALHAARWRTILPYLRGCGPTRFRDSATRRSGRLSALAADLVALASPASSENKEQFFSGHYQRTLLPRVGHFPQREAPDRVAKEILTWLARVA